MHVNSPLNIEAIVGVGILSLWVTKTVSNEPPGTSTLSRFWVAERSEPTFATTAISVTVVLAITLSAFVPCLTAPFLSDDYFLIRQAQTLDWPTLVRDWTVPRVDGFFRPIGWLSLRLDAQWAGTDPLRWHLSSLTIHVINVWLVFLLARGLQAPLAGSVMAALLFGLHGSRPEAVIWTASRFDLLATLFMLASAVIFLRARQTNNSAARTTSFVCMALSALSKETGYVTSIVLILLSVVMSRPGQRCDWRLLPIGVICLVLFGYRWAVLGDIGGYIDFSTGEAEIWSLTALGAIKVLGLRLWANLFFPVNWSRDLGVGLSVLTAANVAGLLALGRSAIPASRLGLSALFAIVMSLPALTQLLIGSNLEKARFLYAPSVGFALLIGFAVVCVPKRAGVMSAAALVLFQMGALQHNLGIWRDVSHRGERVCLDASDQFASVDSRSIVVSGLPRSIDGVYFFANSFPECIAMRSDQSPHRIKVVDDYRNRHIESGTPVFAWDARSATLRRLD